MPGDEETQTQGRLLFVENCGDGCHVLVEEPPEVANGNVESSDEDEIVNGRANNRGLIIPDRPPVEEPAESRNTIKTVTVAVWYTREYARVNKQSYFTNDLNFMTSSFQVTSNIESAVNLQISRVNLGYQKSGANVRVKVACITEASDLYEMGDIAKELYAFGHIDNDDFENAADVESEPY